MSNESMEQDQKLTKRTFLSLWAAFGIALFFLRGDQILKPHNDAGTTVFGAMVLAMFAAFAAYLATMIVIAIYYKVSGRSRN